MDRPLRFCMITAFYPPYNFGGDGIYVHALTNRLAQRGHEVHVIHCIDAYRALAPGNPGGTYQDHPNVTVHALQSRFGPLSPLLTHQTGLPLLKSAQIRSILKQGFDVTHFHTVSLIGGPGVLSYGQGIKLYTAHDHWLVCPTRVLFRFSRAVCTDRYCFLCSLVHKRPPQLWRYTSMLQAAVRHVDAFIVGSRFSEEKHRELGLDAHIVHLPPLAAQEGQPSVATEASLPAAHEPYFLFVGRLMKIKGLQTLIPIFRNYTKARLLVAGSGRYEARLRRMAAGSANIHFLGHVAREQLPALYRGATALIVPSIAYELAPLVVLEAFQQQTPVVVRNLGGAPEYVQEGRAGFVYDTDDELVAALDRLIEDPAYARELGRRGYEAYRQKWTPQAHLRQYLALIHDLSPTQPGAQTRSTASSLAHWS
jgi:glycosyltransferase involved in cell wall biosynthesis